MKIKFELSIGLHNANRTETIECSFLGIDEKKLLNMQEDDQFKLLMEYAEDWASNYINLSAKLLELED